MAISLGNHCSACGKERRPKTIRYAADTFAPYCETVCSVEHPHSPQSVLKRQRVVNLLTLEDAQEGYQEFVRKRFKDNPSILSQLDGTVGKSIQIRMQDPNMVLYVVELQKRLGLSLSETIRFCIDYTMKTYKENE